MADGDKIMHVNTQGFYNGDVSDLVRQHNPLVFVASEHKQTDRNNLRVEGYNLASARLSEQRGVATYVRKGTRSNSPPTPTMADGDKIMHVNTQGFYNGDDSGLVRQHNPLVFVASEHKQTDRGNLWVEGYNLASARLSEQMGVATYVRKGEDYVTRPDLGYSSRDGKMQAASVELPMRNLVVTGHYSSPKSSKVAHNHFMANYGEKVQRESHKEHVMAGDFNIDISKHKPTKEVLRDYGLKHSIRSSTHERGGSLDNFVSNVSGSKSRVMTAQRDQISDHNPIVMKLPSGSGGGARPKASSGGGSRASSGGSRASSSEGSRASSSKAGGGRAKK